MDNVSFHKSQIIKDSLTNYNVIYIPPYSPQFNPIEYIYSIIKSKYKYLYNNDDMLDRINKSMLDISSNIFRTIFRHCLVNIT